MKKQTPYPHSQLPYAVAADAARGEWQPTPPQCATLEWRDGQPYSPQFQDCYFSARGGLEESRYVFLEGSGAVEAMRDQQRARVSIAELGFGSGLNFLSVLQEWMQQPQPNRQLEFLSFERHPLQEDELRRVYSLFPGLAKLAESILPHLPPCIAGMHRVPLPQYNCTLYLVLGDVQEFIPLISASIDFWFLDGFAPAKNEEMWTPSLLAQVARLSAPAAQLSSFSAARRFRDALEASGFDVLKRPGFAGKRDMVFARLRERPSSCTAVVASPPKRVVVIGAGIVGLSSARALARRGLEVTVLEAEPDAALHASGNPAAVLMPYLSAKPDFLSRFYLNCFLYTLRELRLLPDCAQIFSQRGVLRLNSSARLQKVYECLDAQQLPQEIAESVDVLRGSELSGCTLESAAIWHRSGGALHCRRLVEALLEERQFELQYCAPLETFRYEDERWYLEARGHSFSADAIVFCSGSHLTEFSDFAWFPLEAVKGELRYLETDTELRRLKTVLCYEGYLIPETIEGMLLGASYEHGATDLDLSAQVERELLESMKRRLPGADLEAISVCGGRAAYRCMSADRLPLIGAMPDRAVFQAAYLAANDGKFGDRYPSDGRMPQAYCNVAHGSRGFTSAFLSGELLAAQICGGIMPLEADLCRALDPARFLVRAIKRGLDPLSL